MRRSGDRLALAGDFAGAAGRYWLGVFPHVGRELSRWRRRAAEIPDPTLRRHALQAQRKRGNVEGAAAFAAFAPRLQRAAIVRALVAFQAAYDYLDVLAEQPQTDPVAGARGLHEALLDALSPTLRTEFAPGPRDHTEPSEENGVQRTKSGIFDYYAGYPQRVDGGYLAELIDACATALATLPSYPSVAPAARRAAERIVEFQSLNLSEAQGDHHAFEQWARAHTPAESSHTGVHIDLRWWETAGGGGSPLCVYALIAAAAEPGPVLPARDVEAIEHAYFPWIGGLHSLLDHLVDRSCDAAAGQRSLIDYYASPQEAAVRMQSLAERAVGAARALPQGRRHTIVLDGMVAYYLANPGASAPEARPIARGVREAVGGTVGPAMLMFRARAVGGRLAGKRARVTDFHSSAPVARDDSSTPDSRPADLDAGDFAAVDSARPPSNRP